MHGVREHDVSRVSARYAALWDALRITALPLLPFGVLLLIIGENLLDFGSLRPWEMQLLSTSAPTVPVLVAAVYLAGRYRKIMVSTLLVAIGLLMLLHLYAGGLSLDNVITGLNRIIDFALGLDNTAWYRAQRWAELENITWYSAQRAAVDVVLVLAYAIPMAFIARGVFHGLRCLNRDSRGIEERVGIGLRASKTFRLAHGVRWSWRRIELKGALAAAASALLFAGACVAFLGANFFWIISLVLVPMSGFGPDPAFVWKAPAILLGSLLCIAPIVYLARYFAARARQSATHVLSSTTRPPILMLRSFSDDRKAVAAISWTRRLGFRRLRLEEALSRYLQRFGPFIAVGMPGETVPQLGSYKAYFEDAQWQGAVRRLIDESMLVVMIASDTHWVRWELEQVQALGALGKLVVVIPPDDELGLRKRWRSIVDRLSSAHGHAGLENLDTRHLLCASFVDKASIHVARGVKRRQVDYEVGLLVALSYLNDGRA